MHHSYQIYTTVTKYNKWQQIISCLELLNHNARAWASFPACPPSPCLCVFQLSSAITKGSVHKPLSGTIPLIQCSYAITILIDIHLANTKLTLSRGYNSPQFSSPITRYFQHGIFFIIGGVHPPPRILPTE